MHSDVEESDERSMRNVTRSCIKRKTREHVKFLCAQKHRGRIEFRSNRVQILADKGYSQSQCRYTGQMFLSHRCQDRLYQVVHMS